MHFELNADQRALRNLAARFVAKEIALTPTPGRPRSSPSAISRHG